MVVALCTFGFPEITISLARALQKFCDPVVFLPDSYLCKADGLSHAKCFPYAPQKSPAAKLSAAAHLMAELGVQKPDIVHFQGSTPYLLPFLPFLCRFVVVKSLHDPVFHTGEEKWIGRMAQKAIVRLARKVIVMSEAMRAVAADAHPGVKRKVALIPLGVHDFYLSGAERRPAALEPDTKFLLFFGRVSPYKGVEDLLEAVRLSGDRFEHKVVIAGKHLYPVPIPSGLRDRVVVINEFIGDDTLRYLLRHCELVVLPYRDATQSGVLLTAYSFAKPVIVTNVGGLPEMVHEGQTGWIVPPANPNMLAKAIVESLSDPERLRRMGQQGAEMAREKYSWEKIAAATFDLYQDALNASPSACASVRPTWVEK